MSENIRIAIVGGGLSGSECAYLLARNGFVVDLYEMRPYRFSEAHRTEYLAELVCSNSLKSNNPLNPQGLLKEEMRLFGSLIIESADKNSVPAGESLSVDRTLFSQYITDRLEKMEGVWIERKEIVDLEGLKGKYDIVIIATGPLTSEPLAKDLGRIIGNSEYLYFYDAISPVITADSIDYTKAFFASRYDKGGADYLNCPLNEDEYKILYKAILEAECVEPHIKEELKFFEGCLPIEEIARRGYRSLVFGPLKPVGLGFPKDKMPFAVVQLRAENKAKTLYSIVAFQTRMKYGSQEKVLRTIPALRHCEIVRYGQMHRNIYINSPQVLNRDLSLRADPRIFVCGTLMGVEGYVEAAASGIIVAISVISRIKGIEFLPPPDMTAMGLLYRYVIGDISMGGEFKPMNINKGLFLHKGAKRYSNDMAIEAIKKIREYAKRIYLKN